MVDQTTEILPLLSGELSDLADSLVEGLEVLTQLQQRSFDEPVSGSMLAGIGQALVVVRNQQRTVADMWRQVNHRLLEVRHAEKTTLEAVPMCTETRSLNGSAKSRTAIAGDRPNRRKRQE